MIEFILIFGPQLFESVVTKSSERVTPFKDTKVLKVKMIGEPLFL